MDTWIKSFVLTFVPLFIVIDALGNLPFVISLGEELFTSEEFPILYRTWDAYEVTDYFTSDPDYCLVAESEGRVVGFVLSHYY